MRRRRVNRKYIILRYVCLYVEAGEGCEHWRRIRWQLHTSLVSRDVISRSTEITQTALCLLFFCWQKQRKTVHVAACNSVQYCSHFLMFYYEFRWMLFTLFCKTPFLHVYSQCLLLQTSHNRCSTSLPLVLDSGTRHWRLAPCMPARIGQSLRAWMRYSKALQYVMRRSVSEQDIIDMPYAGRITIANS
jgi:hypothetical protein